MDKDFKHIIRENKKFLHSKGIKVKEVKNRDTLENHFVVGIISATKCKNK